MHGPYEERATDGSLQVDGQFTDGLPTGTWRLTGAAQVVTTQRFDRGVPHGEWTERDDDVLVWQHYFAWGQPCGQWQDLVAAKPTFTSFAPCGDFLEPADLLVAGKRAPNAGVGWDGDACPKGSDSATAASDPTDSATRFCAGDGKRHGPFGSQRRLWCC